MRITKDSISIIIPCKDNLQGLQECVEALKKNTQGNYNLIIVDRNSKDGTKEWLLGKEVASHIITNKHKVCVVGAINQGVRVVKTEWFAVVTPSVIVEDRDWLDKMWNYTIDDRVGLVETRVKVKGDYVFAGINCCLIRRRCFEEVGYFDRSFVDAGASDWLMRLEGSRWKTGWCYDTDIKMSETLLFSDRINQMIIYKYTVGFVKDTLTKNKEERLNKEKALLCVEEKERTLA